MMPNKITPLPEILRPKNLNDIVGQEKLLSQNGSITRILFKKPLSSFILWGPPGCGKTTLARVISEELNIESFELSAVFSGVNDLRKIFEKAKKNFSDEKQTILFVDEIHRFNKSQQDAFVEHLDTPGRVVIELIPDPDGRIGFDSEQMFANSPAGRSSHNN